MPTVTLDGQTYELTDGETILDGMERLGVLMESGCRSGICQSCKMVATSGDVPDDASAGLSVFERSHGRFLACKCAPSGDMEIAREDAAQPLQAVTVTALEALNDTVKKVVVQADGAVDFQAGQFFSLVRDDGVARSYSAANLPTADNTIEFHIRRIDGGVMSPWVHDSLAPGDRLQVKGPSGHCVYAPDSLDQPLLLAGTGTGLAPLMGILLDALAHGHTGAIHLFHGALISSDLYGRDALQALADKHSNLAYAPCALNSDDPDVRVGDLGDVILSCGLDLDACKIHLCGDGGYIKSLQRKLFLNGARLNAIVADAFTD